MEKTENNQINLTGVLVFEPQTYLNKAIIAVEDGVAVYSYWLLIEAFMDIDGSSYEEASDHVHYNCIRDYDPKWPIIRDDAIEDGDYYL
jgi:hypothetical protein